jgi:hypothetical protein
MYRSIAAASERLTNHLGRAGRPGAADDDLTAMLFLQTERFLEGVRIRLVELEAGVAVANPRAGVAHSQRPFASHDLLDANGDFHVSVQLPAARFLRVLAT